MSAEKISSAAEDEEQEDMESLVMPDCMSPEEISSAAEDEQQEDVETQVMPEKISADQCAQEAIEVQTPLSGNMFSTQPLEVVEASETTRSPDISPVKDDGYEAIQNARVETKVGASSEE